MSNNQNASEKIYLDGEKGRIYYKVKSRHFIYEDNDGLVVIGNPSFITRDIEEKIYGNYEEYKMLDTEKDDLEKVKESYGMLVDMAKRKASHRKEDYLENNRILKQYINNLTDEEIISYLKQIQKYEELARLTKFFSR